MEVKTHENLCFLVMYWTLSYLLLSFELLVFLFFILVRIGYLLQSDSYVMLQGLYALAEINESLFRINQQFCLQLSCKLLQPYLRSSSLRWNWCRRWSPRYLYSIESHSSLYILCQSMIEFACKLDKSKLTELGYSLRFPIATGHCCAVTIDSQQLVSIYRTS